MWVAPQSWCGGDIQGISQCGHRSLSLISHQEFLALSCKVRGPSVEPHSLRRLMISTPVFMIWCLYSGALARRGWSRINFRTAVLLYVKLFMCGFHQWDRCLRHVEGSLKPSEPKLCLRWNWHTHLSLCKARPPLACFKYKAGGPLPATLQTSPGTTNPMQNIDQSIYANLKREKV